MFYEPRARHDKPLQTIEYPIFLNWGSHALRRKQLRVALSLLQATNNQNSTLTSVFLLTFYSQECNLASFGFFACFCYHGLTSPFGTMS
jgi:hypothetical protein